jgi:hypothetical protein
MEEMFVKVGFMKASKFSKNRDGKRWGLPSHCQINSHSFFNEMESELME